MKNIIDFLTEKNKKKVLEASARLKIPPKDIINIVINNIHLSIKTEKELFKDKKVFLKKSQ